MKTVKCFHCGNKSPQIKKANFATNKHTVVDFETLDEQFLTETIFYDVDECSVCGGVNIRGKAITYPSDRYQDKDDSFPDPDLYPESEFYSDVVLFPVAAPVPVGVPEPIGLDFMTASRVEKIDANAYGVLIGRVLDRVCSDLGAVEGKLANRLDDLAEKGLLAADLLKVAHTLRDFRNIGAHLELGQLNESEVPLVKDLCTAMLAQLYTIPDLAMRAARSLERLKVNGGAPNEAQGAVANLFAKSAKTVATGDAPKRAKRKPRYIPLTGDLAADMKIIADARSDRRANLDNGGQDVGLYFFDP